MRYVRTNRKRIEILALYAIFYGMILFFYSIKNDYAHIDNTEILLLSWASNIVFIVSSYMVYLQDGKKIGLCNIVLLFGFLFNFGQPLLWSLGIHIENELGTARLFSNFPVPSKEEIYTTIFFSIVCYSSVSLGIIGGNVFYCNDERRRHYNDIEKYIYKVSAILGIIIIPLTFVKVFLTLSYSFTHGYINLYYSDFQVAALLDFAERLFFPILVGLLLGSRYKRIKLVYIVFGCFTVLYALAGERGNWVYDLVILIWMHNRYYKKINIHNIIKVFVLGFIALYFVAAIVDLRGVGLSNIEISDFVAALQFNKNPFFRFICEMGNTIGVTLMVRTIGRESFNFGNTFLISLLGAVSSKLADLFGLEYQYLSNYLSQNLLKINYGTGFNFFAESFINGSVIYLILFGLVIGRFLQSSNLNLESHYSFRTFIMLILTPTFCACFRQESLAVFKSIIQIGLLYPLFIWFFFEMTKVKNT